MQLRATKGEKKCVSNNSPVKSKSCSKILISGALTLAVLAALLTAVPSHAQTETVLYNFAGTPDAALPDGALIFDSNGNLYSTTAGGGVNGSGTVFKLTPSGSSWTETILYSFGANGSPDGEVPFTGVIFDNAGNLYGTTNQGGAYRVGTLFKLTPSGTETILHSFGATPADGASPAAGLIFDKKGNLYGTTQSGGPYGAGTVFKLTPSGKEKIVYSFGAVNGDGALPTADLIFDKKGHLYGTTTQGGGLRNGGTVFKLTRSGKETILYSFGTNGEMDGSFPIAGVILDKKGNLYGTTVSGGAYRGGTLFTLTPSGTETILWSFGNGTDGSEPFGDLILDTNGNLYGTTNRGGAYGFGTVFKLTPSGTETILWSFGNGTDGSTPFGSLILDTNGNLLGTTQDGGLYNNGTVFEITP